MSADYNPNPTIVVPGPDSATMDVTGAGNYSTVPVSPLTPGTGSANIETHALAPEIGHDLTDAPALAAVLAAKGELP